MRRGGFRAQRDGFVAACSATMPPVRLRHRTADQPASAIWRASVRLVRPRADRLGEIDVRVRVRRHRTRNPRQRLHQILLVRRREQPVRRRRELAHHQPAARPRHPRHLSQGRGVVDDVAQPEADRHRVEHPVGEWQLRPVGRHLRHVARAPAASMPTEKSAATHHAPDAACSTVDTAVPAARSSTLSPDPMRSAERVARRQNRS